VEKEEILRMLENFGLNRYESRVYTSLVSLGPSRAGVISEQSSVPQSKIYDVLDTLIEKQLVEVFSGRPKEFRAITPKDAFKNLIENREMQLEDMKTQMMGLSKVLQPIQESKEIIGGIWSFKSKKWIEFFNKAAEMLDRSKKYVYAITRDFSRSPRIAEVGKSCIRRGVRIKLIGMEPVNDTNYYKAKWYNSLGIPIRCFETKIHPRIIVADGKEVLIRLDNEPLRKERFSFNSIWSQDQSLVRVFDTYMKNLWNIATPVNFKKIQEPQ